MKKIFSLILFLPLFALAQKDIVHKVEAHESLSSIGRKYNISPRDLAKYNNIDYDKGLSIGQVLKVPGKGKSVSEVVSEPKKIKPEPKPVVEEKQLVQTASNQKGTPIYHIVEPKETLYHISITNGKVPIADIKKWNHLTSDGVNSGTKLIVGYKAGAANAKPVEEPMVKNDPVKQAPVEQEKPVVKNEPVKQVPVITTPKVDVPANRNVNFNGGYFKSFFQSNGEVAETANAAVFKSNSGWDDGKYYCLHNSAAQGSIVKITANGKTIYAKVLDVIPDIKQNSGLTVRISNAAATELGVGENKFDCTINYSK